MRKVDFEFKVGMFVAIGIAIFISMIFSIGSLRNLRQMYNLKMRFDYVNGLEMAAPVNVAGVQVGEVKDIKVIFDKARQRTVVEVLVSLDKEAKIQEDSEAFINMLGLIGEKYIEILPGTPGKRTLAPGDILQGKESVPVEKLVEKGYHVMDNFDRLIDSANVVMDKVKSGEGTIGKLFMDDGLYKELDEFVKDLKAHPWKLLSKPRRQK